MAIPLARSGFRVVGVDRSADMLEVFGRKLAEAPRLAERISLHRQDVCALRLPGRFPLIIMPCYSFAHLTAARRRQQLLRRAHRHLLPGGVLIIETPMRTAGEAWTGGRSRYSFYRTSGARHVLSFHQTRPDRPDLVTLNFLNVLMDGRGNGRPEAVTCREYRATVGELEGLARAAGFGRIKMYRDYRHTPLRQGDRAGILVAEKQGGP